MPSGRMWVVRVMVEGESKTLKWLITSKNSARKTLALNLRGSGCGSAIIWSAPNSKICWGGVMVSVTWKIQGSRISLQYLFLDAHINSVICGGKCRTPVVIEGILACAKASKRGGGVDARWGNSWSGAKHRRCWGQGPLLQLRGMLCGDLGWKSNGWKINRKKMPWSQCSEKRDDQIESWINRQKMKNSKDSNSDVLSQNRTGNTYWFHEMSLGARVLGRTTLEMTLTREFNTHLVTIDVPGPVSAIDFTTIETPGSPNGLLATPEDRACPQGGASKHSKHGKS